MGYQETVDMAVGAAGQTLSDDELEVVAWHGEPLLPTEPAGQPVPHTQPHSHVGEHCPDLGVLLQASVTL